jgi:hypothetical protein
VWTPGGSGNGGVVDGTTSSAVSARRLPGAAVTATVVAPACLASRSASIVRATSPETETPITRFVPGPVGGR